MDYEDEILLEQYVQYENMSLHERDFYINVIRNTKESEDSQVKTPNNSNTKYEIITMSFKKNEKVVRFNGAVGNEEEKRWIDGIITRRGNKYFVATNIFRFNEYAEDDDKEFSSLDIFTVKEDRMLRRTQYNPDNGYHEAELPLFDDAELYDFYYNMINKDNKKKKLCQE